MLHLFYQKYSKHSNIVKYYYLFEYIWSVYFNIVENVICSCDGKAEFSFITPVFSVTWSFRNHSHMLIWCSIFIYLLLIPIL